MEKICKGYGENNRKNNKNMYRLSSKSVSEKLHCTPAIRSYLQEI